MKLIFEFERKTSLKSDVLYLSDNEIKEGEAVLNTDEFGSKVLALKQSGLIHTICFVSNFDFIIDNSESKNTKAVSKCSVSENTLLKAIAITQNPELAKDLIIDD